MSQGQPHSPRDVPLLQQEPIRYGDVFDVSGSSATSKPVAPRDAYTMQSAENILLGQTQQGRPAAVMQSAAIGNERIGAVGHFDASDIPRDQGITVRETTIGVTNVITEEVGGQVVGQYIVPDVQATTPATAIDQNAKTIGEALEATAFSAGDKAVDQSDAAAIQAAEVRATGRIEPGGVAATAQSAADSNPRIPDEAKTKLSDVLSDATIWLPADKPVAREDAEGVVSAEIRNKPNLSTTPGGVADSMAAAAGLNQFK